MTYLFVVPATAHEISPASGDGCCGGTCVGAARE